MVKHEARRWWALGALALSMVVVGLDVTALNVALPTLGTELHATNSQLQWFADAYLLALAALMLPAGLIGDRVGRKRMLVGALVLFGLASIWCAYSSSPGVLIAGRTVLGIAAAVLIPLAMSVLVVLFEPHERQKAVAVLGGANMLGLPLGPIIAGALLQHFWWGSVFIVNVPVVVVGLIAVLFLLPESSGVNQGRLDITGMAGAVAGLLGITYGIIEGPNRGWADPAVLASLVTGLVILVIFVAWERRLQVTEAVADLTLFRSPAFVWGAAGATLVVFPMFGLLFITPQYLHAVLGADALGTGLRLLPVIGGLILGFQAANRAAHKAGPKLVAAFGFIILTAGVGMGALTDIESGYGYVATWFAVFGFGLGIALVTTMTTAMDPLPKQRAGAGSAMLMALRQVGGLIGVAALGTALNMGYHAKLSVDTLPASAADAMRDNVSSGVMVGKMLNSPELVRSAQAAFMHGMGITLWICAATAAVGVVLSLRFLPAPSADTIPTHADPIHTDPTDADSTDADPTHAGVEESGYDSTV